MNEESPAFRRGSVNGPDIGPDLRPTRVRAVRAGRHAATEKAKATFVERIALGDTITRACLEADRSYATFKYWLATDPVFAAALEPARAKGIEAQRANAGKNTRERGVPPDFPEFSSKYLDTELPTHQLRVWDVVCGRHPRSMESSMRFQQGEEPGRFMIMNLPPNHGKSTTWTENYVVWRINRDPDVRVLVISKTGQFARKFLASIKFKLESDVYADARAEFDPPGGWRDPSQPWKEELIYVRGRTRGHKDPTLQGLGIGSQIYGARADLIVLDDVEDLLNVGQYEKHGDWISREVLSRLEPDTGQMMVIGTRVAGMDLYRWLRDSATTMDGKPFYTYFSQPAILENPQAHYDQWRVLWPQRMHARAIAAQKGAYPDRRKFELVYQQNDVSDDAVFPAEAVSASIDRWRRRGPMSVGGTGRKEGMQGAYVVAGLDPATTGFTAAVVIATDRVSKHRWVLNCWNQKGASPRRIIDLIKEWTETYKINEWRVERNAFQRFLTQLPELNQWLTNRGVLLREHYTSGKSKWDPDFGVETLAPLFLSCVDLVDDRYVPAGGDSAMISLPSTRDAREVAELVEQLTVWERDSQGRGAVNDLVMALWFAELGVRHYVEGARFQQGHLRSRFSSRAGRRSQSVVNVTELAIQGAVS